MEELLRFLNELPKDAQHAFAAKCKTSLGYLRKACSKGQKLGPVLCVLLERHSKGRVSRKVLHPNEWKAMWPELAAKGQKVSP